VSKLSEAIDKAKREGQQDTASFAPVKEASPGHGAENATIVPLRSRRPFRRDEPTAAPPVMDLPKPPDRHLSPEEHLVSLTNPHSVEAEQFRALRHLLEQAKLEANVQLVAVTSAAQGDGKSMVAANLAGSLAQNPDARVLLIDADLRAPSIHTLVGLKGSQRGVAELVHNLDATLDDLLVVRSKYNLYVLPAGTERGVPYEVLKSQKFQSTLAETRARFDYVILDTPPVTTFPDTRLLEDHVDGFLLVVGAHKTPRKLVEEAASMFEEEKLLGCVFNGEMEAKSYRSAYAYGRGAGRKPSWWRVWRR
jgi:protein-tyrosine kinase